MNVSIKKSKGKWDVLTEGLKVASWDTEEMAENFAKNLKKLYERMGKKAINAAAILAAGQADEDFYDDNPDATDDIEELIEHYGAEPSPHNNNIVNCGFALDFPHQDPTTPVREAYSLYCGCRIIVSDNEVQKNLCTVHRNINLFYLGRLMERDRCMRLARGEEAICGCDTRISDLIQRGL